MPVCAAVDKQPDGAFEKHDLNGDGKVSREEFAQTARKDAFAKLDKNGDGVVTWEEWKEADHSPQAWERFKSVDLNGDGQITLMEFLSSKEVATDVNGLFITLDSDRDGCLSRGEVQRMKGVQILTIHF